jgi:hypothetical protein
MPPGVGVSGLESDGGDQFFCGEGRSGRVRAVRWPRCPLLKPRASREVYGFGPTSSTVRIFPVSGCCPAFVKTIVLSIL